MDYIANRPLRFDRDYAIGEVIPESVIEPQMTKRLTAMGRIIRIEIPIGNGAEGSPDAAENGAESHAEGMEATDGINIPSNEKNTTEGESESLGGIWEEETTETTGEYRCEVCGKTFKSQNGLAAHSRIHKK